MNEGITGFIQLKKYQENWLLYRSAEESLKREKFMYLHDAGSYCNLTEEDKKKTLVQSVESIISSEASRFFATHEAKPKAVK